MRNIVLEYGEFLKEIPNKIKKSFFRTEFFIKKTGMTKPTFYRKLKKNNFSYEEIKKIDEVLLIEREIEMKIKEAEKDVELGRIEDKEKFLKKIRKELF